MLAGVAPIAVCGSVAYAADQDTAGRSTAPPASATASRKLEEIVVTATRSAKNLQKVSTAVTVVPGAKLSSEGLTNIGSIVSQIPSVQATGQPGGFSVDIRGQGGDLPAGSTQGSVAIEFDGIYNINSQAQTVGFFDVSRIEISAGPQSTRYGPDADGGVVNVITRDPVIGLYSGYANVTAGSYNLGRLEMGVNIPITDKLAVRVAVAGINRGSYFSPAQGNDVGQSVRIKALYKPNDDLSLKLEYQLDHVGGTGDGSNVFPIFTNRVPFYSGGSINNYGNPWDHGDQPTNGLGASHDHVALYQQTFNGFFSYKLNDWGVVDVTSSYLTIEGNENLCFNFPPSQPAWGPWTTGGVGNCFAVHEFHPFYQYSDELRLHSAPGTKITWNLGYYHWNYHWANYWPYQGIAGTDGSPQYSTTTNAVYGEATYPVTPELRLIGGLRESFDQRSYNFGPNGNIPTPTYSRSLTHFDYRAGVEYDLFPKSMEYFTVSTGYRPGGLTYDGYVKNGIAFASEVNTAFEIGSKNRFLNDTLQVNLDGFYYDQSGYQNLDKYTGETVVINGASVVCTNANEPIYSQCQTPTFGLSAYTLGFESQIRYRITEDDVADVNATVLDARFNKKQGICATVDAPAGGGCYDGYTNNATGAVQFFNLAGAVQPHAPKFSANFDYAHTFEFSWGAKFTIGANAFYSSGYWVNPVEDQDKFGWQPAYWQEGLTASYQPAVNWWSLSAYARNLSNYAVKLSVLPATTIGEPLNFGFVLSTRW